MELKHVCSLEVKHNYESNTNNMRESLHKYRTETVNHKLPGTK